ncbi:MAG TPA: DUF4232 domain-containing protein [Streptosporangiales bacterium]
MRKHEPIFAAALAGAALVLAACGTETPSAGGGGTPGSTTESSSASPSRATSGTGTPGTPTGQASSKPVQSKSGGDPGRIRGRCHTGQLSASVRMRDSAAGQRYAWLVLTNRSGTTCTIYGYGGMQLYRSNGDPVPTRMERDRNVPPQLLTIAPGHTARSSLRWTVVPTGSEPTGKACEPVATTAHVTPPDETSYLSIPWHYGQVCDHGAMKQGAYRGTPAKAGS